jgi:hypothetical protein
MTAVGVRNKEMEFSVAVEADSSGSTHSCSNSTKHVVYNYSGLAASFMEKEQKYLDVLNAMFVQRVVRSKASRYRPVFRVQNIGHTSNADFCGFTNKALSRTLVKIRPY